MKAFLDTNALLDALMDNRLGHEATLAILQVIRSGDISACLSSQSVIDAAYIATQRGGTAVNIFRKAIDTIAHIVSIVPIEAEDIHRANHSSIPDYEDAAQLACAERCGCDVIVTSDKKFHGYTDITTFTPFELHSLLFSRMPEDGL